MKHIFITGSTGFVGVNLVRRLLEQDDVFLHLLVRESSNMSALERVEKVFGEFYTQHQLEEMLKRINVVRGNVAEDNLGMSEDVWDELSHKINIIYHSAATIEFNLPYEEAREINTNGTKRILQLASKCHENNVLEVLNHISTAYVCGNTYNTFRETELDVGQEFANTYEQTKFESELEVHNYINEGLPVIIHRPSIIAGSSKTGEISQGSLLFEFIRLINGVHFKEFICNDDSSLNLVPVDYFVDAMVYVSGSEANYGQTFNYVGKSNTGVKEMIKASCAMSNIELPKYIPLDEQDSAPQFVKIVLAVFVTYMEYSHTFDYSQAAEALEGSGIECPDIDGPYSERVLQYCKRKYFS